MHLSGTVCSYSQAYVKPELNTRGGRVNLTGLKQVSALTYNGMARIHALVDGHVTILTINLSSQRGSILHLYSAVLGSLIAGKFRQPWHTRQGTDGALEILFPLKVS